MTEREKLIELLRDKRTCATKCADCGMKDKGCGYDSLADWLLTNGVKIPVRCGECKHASKHAVDENKYFQKEYFVCRSPKATFTWEPNCVLPEHYCSYGERREGDD